MLLDLLFSIIFHHVSKKLEIRFCKSKFIYKKKDSKNKYILISTMVQQTLNRINLFTSLFPLIPNVSGVPPSHSVGGSSDLECGDLLLLMFVSRHSY